MGTSSILSFEKEGQKTVQCSRRKTPEATKGASAIRQRMKRSRESAGRSKSHSVFARRTKPARRQAPKDQQQLEVGQSTCVFDDAAFGTGCDVLVSFVCRYLIWFYDSTYGDLN